MHADNNFFKKQAPKVASKELTLTVSYLLWELVLKKLLPS